MELGKRRQGLEVDKQSNYRTAQGCTYNVRVRAQDLGLLAVLLE